MIFSSYTWKEFTESLIEKILFILQNIKNILESKKKKKIEK